MDFGSLGDLQEGIKFLLPVHMLRDKSESSQHNCRKKVYVSSRTFSMVWHLCFGGGAWAEEAALPVLGSWDGSLGRTVGSPHARAALRQCCNTIRVRHREAQMPTYWKRAR